MISRGKYRVICQGKFILLIYESETVWHLLFMLQTQYTQRLFVYPAECVFLMELFYGVYPDTAL